MAVAMNGPLTTARRRGGRVVECTALEMRHTCKGIVGSNPTLSAITLYLETIAVGVNSFRNSFFD